MRQTPPFAQLLPDFLFKSGGSEVSAEPVVFVRLRPNSSDRYWFGGAPPNGNPCRVQTNGTSEGDCYWFGGVTTGVPLPCRVVPPQLPQSMPESIPYIFLSLPQPRSVMELPSAKNCSGYSAPRATVSTQILISSNRTRQIHSRGGKSVF